MRTERIASSSPKHSEAYGVQDFFLPTVHEMFPFSLDIDNKSIEFPEISPVSPCDSDHKNAASPSTSQHVSKENGELRIISTLFIFINSLFESM